MPRSTTPAESAAQEVEPPEGLVAFVKRDCPTCELVAPVLERLHREIGLVVVSQDDPHFPDGVAARHDADLGASWRNRVQIVPTLLRVGAAADDEEARAEGWHRERWRRLTGVDDLGEDLPEARPGCGSLSADPEHAPALRVRFEGDRLRARRIELARLEDEHEALFQRGFTDGLPVVPPTERRVLEMLDGTTRAPDEMVALVPPNLIECTVEKVAINAVMAGCRPEYLPVVLAAVEASCNDTFNMHGLLATTMGVGPVLVINGPIRRELGMNSGINVLGQGNRANSTIGRALQLVVRNVGGGRPGEVDRATFGSPAKVGFCFPEDEEGSPWTPLATDFGLDAGVDAVTVFAGEGPRNIVDQLSRDPESLSRSFAACLRTLHHPKLMLAFDAILVVGPEHGRVFREAGWSKADLVERLAELMAAPADEVRRGAGGMAEGLPVPAGVDTVFPKFRPGGLLVVHAGGGAGLFSAVLGGWVNGEVGSQPVCRPIER